MRSGPLVAFLVVVRFDEDGDPIPTAGNTYAIGSDGNVFFGWKRGDDVMIGDGVFTVDEAKVFWAKQDLKVR
jgi:hypothetical protein